PVDYAKMVELGSSLSLPLRDIARELQKTSRNLDTDLLLAHLGEKLRSGQDAYSESSEELGIRALNGFLPKTGIKQGQVVFEEGSGLSRDNLTTPEATVALLRYVNQQDYSRFYLDALPIAGVDGTLKNRMKSTPAEGN